MQHENLDVVIIGAGLSGVGAGVHLSQKCPGKRFALLEMREAMGGTWDLFRYPGIRSDSDMYTLGYHFKPWTNPKAIADGEDIRSYIQETAREYGIDRKIRYQHKVKSLNWNSKRARWELEVEQLDTGDTVRISAQFVICCSGYYKYESGHTPEFAGREDFGGEVIHPQLWPEGLDYSGKRIVVIGSGATAVTLVPALTDKAAHVTMLQRSPSYVINVPQQDKISNKLREYLPEQAVYSMARVRNVLLSMTLFNFARRYPKQARRLLMGRVKKALEGSVDLSHFSPKYNVWDERLCAVPDGDMFDALKSGKASVVTDQIERFTQGGILLKSGEEIPADIIVTATGLELQVLGGSELTKDGEPVKVAEKYYYKGAMLQDVPNLAMVFGYTNSSWTLKADLILDYFCRVMNHMQKSGQQVCTPTADGSVEDGGPFLNLNSGYVKRALHLMPRQGAGKPWKLYQNYVLDYVMMKLTKLDDGALSFSNPVSRGTEEATPSLSEMHAAQLN
ncbi:MAG: NAD(P)/FAD-dependent oxidoreductase [Polyangiaceae bacterium]|nr:NAD(P)/FAD-dependent oxidoreductase [Polyangiaceae bacterium]MCB9606816.1 NAD(P)/FAD-dependent oxidoreductase [Polyangiaceae bacterium]